MAWSITGGATRQKIDLQEIIDNTITTLLEIETSDRSQSEKTKAFGRLADHVRNQLQEDGRVNEENKVAVSTYKRYMTKVRNAIKDTGLTHHSLQWTSPRSPKQGYTSLPQVISKLRKTSPEYIEMLEELRNEHATTIGAKVNEIIKSINASKGKQKQKRDALKLIKGDKTTHGLMFNHEILYHLYLSDFDKGLVSEQAMNSLSDKKTGTIKLNYADILKAIHEGFESKAYSKRAFALALASGRRAIEIIFNASFTKTGGNTVMFDGQAKKQAGIEVAPFEIYTLVPADEFIKAFEEFRNMEAVQKIHEDFGELGREERNTKINGRTAKTFNETAKRLLNDRIFKDSRTIYTRVCIDTFYETDDKWIREDGKRADEDVFLKHLLGHGDVSTADSTYQEKTGREYGGTMNYKQFKIDYTAPASTGQGDTQDTEHDRTGGDSADGQQQTAKKKGAEPREIAEITKAMKQFIDANPERERETQAGSVGLLTLHEKVAVWMQENPTRKITLSALYKKDKGGIGGRQDTIRDYLCILSQTERDKFSAKGEAFSLSPTFTLLDDYNAKRDKKKRG